MRLKGDQAIFYRVLQHEGVTQTALVLLNKADAPAKLSVSEHLQSGQWRDAFTGKTHRVRNRLQAEVPAHGVRVFVLDAPITRADTRVRLAELMARKAPKAD